MNKRSWKNAIQAFFIHHEGGGKCANPILSFSGHLLTIHFTTRCILTGWLTLLANQSASSLIVEKKTVPAQLQAHLDLSSVMWTFFSQASDPGVVVVTQRGLHKLVQWVTTILSFFIANWEGVNQNFSVVTWGHGKGLKWVLCYFMARKEPWLMGIQHLLWTLVHLSLGCLQHSTEEVSHAVSLAFQ